MYWFFEVLGSESVNNKHQQEWDEKLHTVSKLRTYVTFKLNYETETYLKLIICKAENISFSSISLCCTST